MFLADLENLGKQLERAQASYVEAHKKLSSGAGNIIGKVKILQELGAKTSKEIPGEYLGPGNDDEEEGS